MCQSLGAHQPVKKTVLISLSHQMGVKISVRSIFMYKINKHFICSLPKCVEGYVINLWCFSKLICKNSYCCFWKIAIFLFQFPDLYKISIVGIIKYFFIFSNLSLSTRDCHSYITLRQFHPWFSTDYFKDEAVLFFKISAQLYGRYMIMRKHFENPWDQWRHK